MNPITSAGHAETAGKALAFAHYAASLMLAKGDPFHAVKIFEARQPLSRFIDVVRKSTVAAGTTTDATWAAPLAQLQPISSAFVEYLRPQTILGRMSGFRRMPFGTRAPRATSGTSVSWLGQNATAPASSMAFDTMTFKPAKIGGVVAITEELATSSDPDAAVMIRADLAAAVAQFSDQAFCDPALAEVADISPASITYNAPTIAATGTTASAFRDDFKALTELITTSFTEPFLIMTPATAISLATLGDSSGLLKNIGAKGGDIAGIPVITSGNVPADANSPGDGIIILCDAAEIFLNEGAIELDASKNALLEMSSAPDSPATASTTMVSLWQHNMLGILIRRFVRWQPRRSGGVAYLTGVRYSG